MLEFASPNDSKENPMVSQQATREKRFFVLWHALIIIAAWFVLHAVSIDWGLPALSESTADAIPPRVSYSAYDMMKNDTFKYGPLQYYLVAMFAPACLLGLQMMDVCRMFDWPLLVFAVLASAVFFLRRRMVALTVSDRHLLMVTGLIFISSHLFYNQVVRFSFPRYAVTLLPFAALSLGMAWDRLRGVSSAVKYAVWPVLLWQGLIAGQFIYNMNNTPLAQIRDAMLFDPNIKNMTSCTATAADGFYLQMTGANIKKVKALRSWNQAFNFYPRQVPDIYLSKFFLAMLEPNLLILAEPSLTDEKCQILADSGYRLVAVFDAPIKTMASEFKTPNFKDYYISPHACGMAVRAYKAAGRADAGNMAGFIAASFPNQVFPPSQAAAGGGGP